MNDFRSEGLKAIHEFLGELEGEVNNTKEKAGEVSHYLGMYLNDVEKRPSCSARQGLNLMEFILFKLGVGSLFLSAIIIIAASEYAIWTADSISTVGALGLTGIILAAVGILAVEIGLVCK